MGSEPGITHFTIYQGATFKHVLAWRDEEDAVITLTGFTARMQVRPYVEATRKILELTTENGGITINGADGEVELYVSHTATAALKDGRGVYDLELVDPAGEITRLLEGKIFINKEVTR